MSYGLTDLLEKSSLHIEGKGWIGSSSEGNLIRVKVRSCCRIILLYIVNVFFSLVKKKADSLVARQGV